MDLVQRKFPDVFGAVLYLGMAEKLDVDVAVFEDNDPRAIVVDTEHERYQKLEDDFQQSIRFFLNAAKNLISQMLIHYEEELEQSEGCKVNASFGDN